MGGYGAVELGLSNPDVFAAVASLSGTCDLAGLGPGGHDWAFTIGPYWDAGIQRVLRWLPLP